MKKCIFCKIVAGKIPSHKVYEDESVLAFLDIHPVNPGHTLVVPKTHVDEFQDMGGDLYEHVMEAAQKIARQLKKTLKPPRVGLIVYGFDVSHAHAHVLPLHKPGDISLSAGANPSQQELTDTATRLRE